MMPLLIAVRVVMRKRSGAWLSSGWQQGCASNGFSSLGKRRGGGEMEHEVCCRSSTLGGFG